MSDNIVTFGLRNVCYSLINNADGNINYLKSKKIPCAQEMSIDLKGGSSSTFADDKTCAIFNLIEGFSMNLKVTELPEDFKLDVLGYKKDKNNNLIEATKTLTVPFALGYELSGDVKKRRIWHLFCTADPISLNTKSKTDGVEANAIQLIINTYSLILKKYEVSRVVCNEGASNYEGFLDAPPNLKMITKKVYLFDLSREENDRFAYIFGNVSSINGYTYNNQMKTKGLKLNSNYYIDIYTSAEAKEVTIKLVGYCNNNTASARVLVEDKNELTTFYAEGNLPNKNIKELSFVCFKAVAGHTYKIRKGDAEAMIVLVEKTEVFEE